MSHDQQTPPQQGDRQTFRYQEIVQYNDGEMALGFRTPGDVLLLGPDSIQKYARNFDISDMAIIRTQSGNVYCIAGGLVLNRNEANVFDLPDGTITVVIGEPCIIPGVSTTTPVESVQLRYKTTAPGADMAQHQIDQPSPFKALDRIVDTIHEQRDTQ